MIRGSGEVVKLIVCQPAFTNEKKSSLLTMSKKVRQRTQPSRVRFAEGVTVSSAVVGGTNSVSSWLPHIPNVLRVFLENDQTKIFRYDTDTTVEEVLLSLKEKLNLHSVSTFGLFVEQPQSARSCRLQLLSHSEYIATVAARPGSQQFRCVLRVAFYPFDPGQHYHNDPVAFDYLYQQCVNDLKRGRFLDELRFEPCLRIAALHIQQVLLDRHGGTTKLTLKKIERYYGLETFLPTLLLESIRKKEIRKHLRYYLKRDSAAQKSSSKCDGAKENGTLKSIKELSPSQQLKARYMHILSHQQSFGGKQYQVSIKNTVTEMTMTVACNSGVLLQNVSPSTTPAPVFVIYYNTIMSLAMSTDPDGSKVLIFTLSGEETQVLEFIVPKDDVEEAVNLVQGYHKLATDSDLDIIWLDDLKVPPYESLHHVFPSMWNYACNHSLPEDVCIPYDLRVPLPDYVQIVKEIKISQSHTLQQSPAMRDSNFNQMPFQPIHDTVERPLASAPVAQRCSFVPTTLPLQPEQSASSYAGESPSRMLQRYHKRSTDSCCSEVANLSSMSGSESETLSTPSDSPMHRNLGKSLRSLKLNPIRGSSFGLHSPDALPCGNLPDGQLEKIVSALGIQGSPLEELLLLFPDNFVADRDIIDLTKITKPEMTDVVIRPPTPFQDETVPVLSPIFEPATEDVSPKPVRKVSFDERVLVSPIASRRVSEPPEVFESRSSSVDSARVALIDRSIDRSTIDRSTIDRSTHGKPPLPSRSITPSKTGTMVNGLLQGPAPNGHVGSSVDSCSNSLANQTSRSHLIGQSNHHSEDTNQCPSTATFSYIRKCTLGHVEQLDSLLERLPARSPRRSAGAEAEAARDVLTAAQCFASSSKLLLRAVGDQGTACETVAHLLKQSGGDLKALTSTCFILMHSFETLSKAQLLGAKTREVLLNFDLTLKLADSAQGKDIRDPKLRKLLRQSTALAAALTSFIQAVDVS